MDREMVRKLLIGLMAGEALGATSEFATRDNVRAILNENTAWPLSLIGGGTFGWEPGQMTDDGEQALMLLTSVCDGVFNPAMFAEKLVAWYQTNPRDIGSTTRASLSRLAAGEPWTTAAFQTYASSPFVTSNGSLMRNGVIAPLAADLETALTWSVLQSIVTHYHPECVIACAAHTWLLWRLLEGEFPLASADDAWGKRFHAAFVLFASETQNMYVRQWIAEVERTKSIDSAMETFVSIAHVPYEFDPFENGGASSSALGALHEATWALLWSRATRAYDPVPEGFSREVFAMPAKGTTHGARVLAWCALLGGDSDTLGAVAGPLMSAANDGELNGLNVVPEQLEGIRKFDALFPASSPSSARTPKKFPRILEKS